MDDSLKNLLEEHAKSAEVYSHHGKPDNLAVYSDKTMFEMCLARYKELIEALKKHR